MQPLADPGPAPRDEGAPNRPRPRFGRLRGLYLTLRTEHTTPGKVALGVGIGVFVGLSPFWGLHLAICVLLATMFRLNRVLVYAAANLASVVAPVAVIVELAVGHRLLRHAWLELSWSQSSEILGGMREQGLLGGLLSLSADFLVGGVVVSAVAGLAAGAATWVFARLGREAQSWYELVDRVTLRYLEVSIRDAEASRRALVVNPAYGFLLAEPSFASARRVLDLGCGRGLVAALALDAGLPVPANRAYVGVDRSERHIRVAREVYGAIDGHDFQATDLRDFDPPAADVVVLFNTLRYLPVGSQDALLRRLGRALPSGARIFVRDIDAGAGWRATAAVVRDLLGSWLPGRTSTGLHVRRASDLRNALVAAGFEVIDRTTPRRASPARILLEAVRRPKPA
jgi:SAM-dependent methyltransferase